MSAQVNIYLLAQNRLLLEALARILRKRAEFSVVHATAYSPESIGLIDDSGCDVLLVDSSVTDAFGFQVVQDTLSAVDGLKALMIGMEEDEETFLKAVSAGAAGYVLKDASALDVVAAIRAISRDEAVCPPRLCRSLFRYVAGTCTSLPNMRVKTQLGLTRRQQQLVPLLAQGLTNKEIAVQLNLSEQTVKNHVHRMLQKVGADDRLSVVEIVKVNQVFL
ncbi:MAG TPA: response regulator transcription factor [Terriglobia bacterium]|nr:response regulator transcription factor [Terriglobia bacterium]